MAHEPSELETLQLNTMNMVLTTLESVQRQMKNGFADYTELCGVVASITQRLDAVERKTDENDDAEHLEDLNLRVNAIVERLDGFGSRLSSTQGKLAALDQRCSEPFHAAQNAALAAAEQKPGVVTVELSALEVTTATNALRSYLRINHGSSTVNAVLEKFRRIWHSQLAGDGAVR